MLEKAQVTSSIGIKTEWEVDEQGLSHDLVGTFYREEKPSDGTYIEVKTRKMFVEGKEITGLDIPFANIRYTYDIWVPGDYGHDNNPEYILQDYKRCLQFWHNEWYYQGCVATVTLTVKATDEKGTGRINTMVIGRDSLWGIESDCGKSHEKEIEADCLREAKLEAKEVLMTIRNMTEKEIEELFDE